VYNQDNIYRCIVNKFIIYMYVTIQNIYSVVLREVKLNFFRVEYNEV